MAVTDKKKHEYIRIHLWLRPVTTVPYRLKINQKIWYKRSHGWDISEVTQNESPTLSPYRGNTWWHQRRRQIGDSSPESEKPRQRVINADRKFLRIRKVLQKKWRISRHFGKCPDTIQNIQIICNVSGWTGKFPDDLKSVGMNWNLSRWCSVRII